MGCRHSKVSDIVLSAHSCLPDCHVYSLGHDVIHPPPALKLSCLFDGSSRPSPSGQFNLRDNISLQNSGEPVLSKQSPWMLFSDPIFHPVCQLPELIVSPTADLSCYVPLPETLAHAFGCMTEPNFPDISSIMDSPTVSSIAPTSPTAVEAHQEHTKNAWISTRLSMTRIPQAFSSDDISCTPEIGKTIEYSFSTENALSNVFSCEGI